MSNWKPMPLTKLSSEARFRYMDRLLGEDPTPTEICEIWRDRHPEDQEYVELDELELLEREDGYQTAALPLLEQADLELWRAKMRAELGSLAAILDGMDICQIHGRLLPTWLNERVMNALGALGSFGNTKAASPMRAAFKQEATQLRTRLRAGTVKRIRKRGVRLEDKETPNLLAKLPLLINPTIAAAADREGVELFPECMSLTEASEIASVVLADTWASGTPETMLAAYKKAKAEVKLILEVEALTEKQLEYLDWGLEYVRPATLEALGLDPVSSVLHQT